GGLQYPPSTGELRIEVLQKTAMEAIGTKKAPALQPAVVGRYVVHAFEARTLEHLCGDVRALLGGIHSDRVQGVELAGEQTEERERHTDQPPAQRSSERARRRGIRVDQLKQAWAGSARVLENQAMEECRAAARHARDEHGCGNWSRCDGGAGSLHLVEVQ